MSFGLHQALQLLLVFLLPRWGGQAALNLASACNNAIKVMRYTRHFWFGVQCAWLVQSWHTLLRALALIWSSEDSMNFENLTEKELWDIANPIMDNLMDGSTEVDHLKHCQDFTQRMLDIVTAEYLEKLCTQYQYDKGFFSERVPIAIFKRPDSVAFVWKQSFTKAKGEFVAEMILVHQNGKFLVDHVMVF